MAVHEDGTMDVRVDDKPERRRYSINVDSGFSNRYLERMQSKYEPELRDGEEVFWSIGDDIPTIVTVRAPDPLRYNNDEERYLSHVMDEFGHGR